MGIKERVHKKLVEIDNSLLKELEKAEKKYGKINISSDEVEKIANHYVQKMTDKTIDLTLQEVKEAIEEFEKKGFHRKDKKMISYWFTYNEMFELKKQLGIKDG